MSEEVKNVNPEAEEEKAEETAEEQNTAEEEKKAPIAKKAKKAQKGLDMKSADDAVNELSRGKLKLFKPFIADDAEITELAYDFENLGGPELVRAMDRGAANGGNAFRITSEQALELFIASAGKETDGCDAADIRRGLSSVDAVKAVQLATVFFVASSQAGNARITK